MKHVLYKNDMFMAHVKGNKTQTTRRIVVQPGAVGAVAIEPYDDITWMYTDGLGHITKENKFVRCPYGVQGEIVYLREYWRIVGIDVGSRRLLVCYSSNCSKRGEMECFRWVEIKSEERFWYYHRRTTKELEKNGAERDANGNHIMRIDDPKTEWREMHKMPEVVARHYAKIGYVEVIQIQDITEEEIIDEGVEYMPGYGKRSNRDVFIDYWDKFNINKDCSYSANPFVWKITFERKT